MNKIEAISVLINSLTKEERIELDRILSKPETKKLLYDSGGIKNKIMSKIGMLAELTKRQTNREYFSDLPVGTKFIIVDEIDLPTYDLTGYFLRYEPHILANGSYHFTGYIEKGSWKLIGEIKDNIEVLKNEA